MLCQALFFKERVWQKMNWCSLFSHRALRCTLYTHLYSHSFPRCDPNISPKCTIWKFHNSRKQKLPTAPPSWYINVQATIFENLNNSKPPIESRYCFTKIIGIKPDIYRFQIYWFYPLAEARARVTENALQWEKTRHHNPEFNLTKDCQKVAKRHWPWHW